MSDTSLNKFLAQGNDAAEGAFTPNPPTGLTPEQVVLFVNTESTAVLKYWDGATFTAISGGGGTPGGSNTQVQYNNSSAFGGITGATTDGTTLTLVAPVLGTPASGTLTNCTGLPVGTGVSGFGTGVATALAINVGSAGAPVTFNGALGTPSSGTLSSCTGYPAASLATISAIYVNVQHQEAQNTSGGTFTSGAWRTRPLNTEVSDVGNLCSLASNQMTLSAGTYIIAATALGYSCNRHQLRLQNVTDTATVLTGISHFNSTTVSADCEASLRGIFTIGASKALELQHQCETTQATNGFGVASNFTTEVYAIVELWKIG